MVKVVPSFSLASDLYVPTMLFYNIITHGKVRAQSRLYLLSYRKDRIFYQTDSSGMPFTRVGYYNLKPTSCIPCQDCDAPAGRFDRLGRSVHQHIPENFLI